MQTFLPFEDFEKSANSLDNKRLGKQRVECLQLLNALKIGPVKPEGKKTPWYNHPACKMWRGYEKSLSLYGLAVCSVWIGRGFKDTCYDKIQAIEDEINPYYQNDINPPWLGNKDFHFSHQSNLIRKNADFYRPIFGFDVPDGLPYIWPV